MFRPVLRFLVLALLPSAVFAQSSLVDRARAALDHNDPDTAATLLEQAAAQTPQNADVHYLLGVAYGEQAEKASVFHQYGLAKKTRAQFENAVQLDPNHLDARYSLVQYYTDAPSFLGGGSDKARAQAAEIAKRNPGYGHLAFAYIAMKQNDLKTATSELQAALAINPNDKDASDMLKKIRERERK